MSSLFDAQRLLEYCEGESSADEKRKTEARLKADPEVARDCADIGFSLSLLSSLSHRDMPDDRADRVRGVLRQQALASRKRRLYRHALQWASAAAAAAALAAGLFAFQGLRNPSLEIRLAQGPASQFEEVALALHAQICRGGTASYDLATRSPEEAKRWIRWQVRLDAGLAEKHPGFDEDQFVLQGAQLVEVAGAPAVRLTYWIDSHPVTLLTVDAESLKSAPEASLAGKLVHFRNQGSEFKMLTFTCRDQAYALVSGLPELGQKACHICHSEPGSQQFIAAMNSNS